MGPGLRKTRTPALVGEKSVRLVRLSDPATRDWLEIADVMSEGRVDRDGPVARYFGSTSVLLVGEPQRGLSIDDLVALVEGDIHLRIRVIRLARREALARAMLPLGTATLELTFARRDRGVAITIDVSAAVAARGRALGE